MDIPAANRETNTSYNIKRYGRVPGCGTDDHACICGNTAGMGGAAGKMEI